MNDEIRALQRDLIEDMTEYMKGEDFDEDDEGAEAFDAGYSQEHIARVGEILDSMFEALAELAEGEEEGEGEGEEHNAAVLEIVKTAVLELNAINEETEGSLIETDQREQLCEIIIVSAREAGLVSDEYDITEQWRDW